MRFLKRILPWLLAGCCVIPFLFFASAIPFVHYESVPAPVSPFTPLSLPSLESGSQDLPEQMISTLPLIPPREREVALVASMIENHEDARAHQKGLAEAIMVFELIVEGDISRFLALFAADKLPKMIGPVRSLRPHFVSIANGYKPLLLHAGGSQFAYDALENSPALINHDGLRYDGETYERSDDSLPPHNLFIGRVAVQSVVAKESLQDFSLPLFEVSAAKPSSQEHAKTISVDFGAELHDVTFTYENWKNHYVRSIEGAPKQATPENILILEAYIEGYGDYQAIPWTQTFGGGKLLLFRDGKVIEGAWKREKEAPFAIFDESEEPLQLAPGQIWLMMQPSLNKVSWE